MNCWEKNAQEVEKALGTSIRKGLSEEEAKKRLEEYGENTLSHEGKKKGLIARFFAQLNDFMVIVLICASAVSFAVSYINGEKDFMDSAIILVIVAVNAILGMIQESKAEKALEALKKLSSPKAKVLREARVKEIDGSEVVLGDILILEAGDYVCADARLIETASLKAEESAITGESLPVDKGVGDEVSSGTINQFGSFDMKATKVGEDSSIQRMIRLVESADAEKAKIVGVADKWATWIVVIALISAALTWLISGEIIRSVTILVVFCPCALVLATPTAIMAAIGNATKHGFLVREGDALERLAAVRYITFDKTGTLTYGTPNVVAVESIAQNVSEKEIYMYAASAEQRSEHPLGKAILRCYENHYQDDVVSQQQFQMIPGRGVQAVVKEKEVIAGNIELLQEKQISIPHEALKQAENYFQKGCTIIFVALENKLSGFIALADTLREDAPKTIAEIKKADVVPVLLTGDHENAAKHIAKQLEMEQFYFNCLPEDKLNYIANYQNKKEQVCMIGDGINDAPALKKAYVGIAMGGIGSDVAVDAADIVLVNDDMKQLPHLLYLAKRMMITIKCNLTFSMLLNFIAIILAMTGILNPVVGALVHNAGSVIVIVNSAFLLKWRKKYNCDSK